MLNVVLTQSPEGWALACRLGADGGVVAFLAAPLALVGLTSVVVCALAMCAGPGCGDPRRVRRGPSGFWIFVAVACAVVLLGRGVKDRAHTVQVVAARPVAPPQESLEEAVSRLEKQLDRASDRLDQQINHQAAQIDSQVDRGTADMVRQLERTAAQIIKQLEHLAEQSARRQHAAPRHTTVAQAVEEPAVVEPKAPALPTSAAAPSASPTAPAAPAVADSKSAGHDSTSPAASAASAQPAPAAAATGPDSTPEAQASSHDSAGVQAPEWTKSEIVDDGNRKLVVVSGGFAGDEKDAQQQALQAARLVVGDALQRANPKVGTWLPTSAAVREDAVRLTYIEKIHRKTVSSGTPFIVYRAYHQVELSPAIYGQLMSSWREDVVPRRLAWLGGLAGLLTLTFATGAAYFRLDDRTHGRYRGRLRLAAATIIAAGAAVGFVAARSLI